MKRSELIVRLADEKDGDAITEFQLAMAMETENKKLNRQIVEKGVHKLFRRKELGFYIVCEYEGRIVASTMITFEWSDWRGGLFYWIQSVYVVPDFRRKGIFREIYAFVKKLVKEDPDLVGIRLYVEKENSRAISVYRNLGMSECDYRMFEEEIN